jgi:hypothetical protein
MDGIVMSGLPKSRMTRPRSKISSVLGWDVAVFPAWPEALGPLARRVLRVSRGSRDFLEELRDRQGTLASRATPDPERPGRQDILEFQDIPEAPVIRATLEARGIRAIPVFPDTRERVPRGFPAIPAFLDIPDQRAARRDTQASPVILERPDLRVPQAIPASPAILVRAARAGIAALKGRTARPDFPDTRDQASAVFPDIPEFPDSPAIRVSPASRDFPDLQDSAAVPDIPA